MKIESVEIENFRSFKKVVINFNNYTCLVGGNGSGKSTILYALNVFFREKNLVTEQLTAEDFYHKNTDKPIEITVTFGDLSKEAQEDFKDYYRQGKLVITAKAEFDKNLNKAEVKQYGNRLVMSKFKNFFEDKKARKGVRELQETYKKIKNEYPDLPTETTIVGMESALRKYEESHPENCELAKSEDEFYGISKGAKLGNYIQWVYVPAVKDFTSEQSENKNTALEKILSRTVRSKINFSDDLQKLEEEARQQYQNLLDSKQSALKNISESLQKKLNDWAHPDTTINISWQHNSDKSVRVEQPLAGIIAGEGSFEGDLARFGHGLQRSYLLALLQELATCDNLTSKLILGCEEPELYQHPPQQRHLSSVLKDLSKRNSQVIVTTHSPLFVSGDGFEDVRLVRKDTGKKESFVSSSTYKKIGDAYRSAAGKDLKVPEAILAKIHQTLQPSIGEMFFCSRLILVEGLEDIAYITTYLHLMNFWNDYRRLGFNIVAVGGKDRLINPLIIAKHMNINTYVVFDSDAHSQKPEHRTSHEKDNKVLLNLLGSSENHFPVNTVWDKNFVMWNSEIGQVVKNDIGEQDWQRFSQIACAEYGHAGGLEKNSLYLATILNLAWKENKKSENLEKLCHSIMAI